MSEFFAAGKFGPSPSPLPAAVDAILNAYFGVLRPVASMQRRPNPYGSSYPLEELDITFVDGSRLPLLLKDLSPGALSPQARLAKPDFLLDPRREIGIYQSILERHYTGTARCYGAVVEPSTDRYWLFLERVDGAQLTHIGDFEVWRQVARWLADWHTRLERKRKLWAAAPLLAYNRDYYQIWPGRARQLLSEGINAEISRLLTGYKQVIERLLKLPITLLHGEFYASNVLIQYDQAGSTVARICPVDWEMAALGPGLVDLAALISGSWSETQKLELAAAYQDALPESTRQAWPDFQTTLDCCRLHLAVQWLGWSAQWSPPPERAHDWLAEALMLMQRLEPTL